MAPYCEQSGHSVKSCSQDQVNQAPNVDDVAAPETLTPSPGPTPPDTPSPPPPLPLMPLEQQELLPVADFQEEIGLVRVIPLPHFNMNPIPVMQHGAPDYLPIDHNLPQLLRQVTGTDDLGSVQVLKLRVIAREMSLQRLCLYLPSLQELILDGSCLGSLRDLGCGLTSLQVLRVTRCGLESLDGTFGLTSLQELHAGNNQIHDVGPCTSLPRIRSLDIHRNPVCNISYVGFLSFCAQLQSLVLAECPVAAQPDYKATVRRLVPQLVTLDGEPLDPEYCGDVIPEMDSGDDDDDDDQDNDANENSSCGNSGTPLSRASKVSSSPINSSSMGGGEGSPSDSLPSASEEDSSRNTNSTSSVYNGSADSFQTIARGCPSREVLQRQRPSTAHSCEGQHRLLDFSTLRKKRPVTAGSATSPDTAEDETSLQHMADERSDSPSILTSGIVVCGNLTAALRGRRRRLDAWGSPRENEQVEPDKAPNIQEMPAEQIEAGDGQHITAGEPQDELLEASRRWRQLYTSYRSENKQRWEKEISEEDNSLQKDRKQEINTESQKKVVRKQLHKYVQPCCSNLFAPQEKASESSYDADTSSNIDLSPEADNINRRKKCLRGPQRLL